MSETIRKDNHKRYMVAAEFVPITSVETSAVGFGIRSFASRKLFISFRNSVCLRERKAGLKLTFSPVSSVAERDETR